MLIVELDGGGGMLFRMCLQRMAVDDGGYLSLCFNGMRECLVVKVSRCQGSCIELGADGQYFGFLV